MRFTNMKQKTKALLSMLLFLSFTMIAFAQKTTVTGVVKDAQSGDPIMGANILEKFTTKSNIDNQ